MSHINSAINRLEKMIDSDLLNKVLSDSVIEQLTDDQVILELRHEKTSLRGFQPGPTQTGLYNHRRQLEA